MSTQALVAHSPIGFVVAFGAGIVSFLSPCVLPLVPGYLSLMSGVGSSQLAVATRTDRTKLLRSTGLFVAGFTAGFVGLEAVASPVSRLLRRHQVLLNRGSGILIIVMGLLMAGL